MFKELRKNRTMTQCTGNLNKDTEILRKNQMEIVNVKKQNY